MDVHQTKKLLHDEGSYQRNKKAAYVWQKIFADEISDKGLIFKIHKRPQTTQHQKKKKIDWKMGRRPEWTFFQKRNTDDQYIHEMMFNITNPQRNANQNHNELPPHTCQNGYYQNTTNNTCWQRCGKKGTFVHCWWKCQLVQSLWTTVQRFPKN